MSNENNNHNYDGIIEENNKMPSWWVWLFLLSIMYAFFYFIHYEFGGADNLQQEFVKQMAEIKKKQNAVGLGQFNEEQLLQLSKDVAVIELGKAQYISKCASCHGQNLEGLIGPNLTDHFWLHGQGKLTDIAKVVSEGVLSLGMPQWSTLLKEDEIAQVVAFIHTKLDSKPANAKAPQGTEFK